jgi:hypothetical protein
MNIVILVSSSHHGYRYRTPLFFRGRADQALPLVPLGFFRQQGQHDFRALGRGLGLVIRARIVAAVPSFDFSKLAWTTVRREWAKPPPKLDFGLLADDADRPDGRGPSSSGTATLSRRQFPRLTRTEYLEYLEVPARKTRLGRVHRL